MIQFTYPNNQQIITASFDLATYRLDLEDKIKKIKEDERALTELAHQGRERYRQHSSQEDELEMLTCNRRVDIIPPFRMKLLSVLDM